MTLCNLHKTYLGSANGLKTQVSQFHPSSQREGEDLQKIESLAAGRIFFARKGDKPEKWGVGGGGCHFFITLQFNHIYCVFGGGSKVPFITFWVFSLFSNPCKILIQVFIVLKPDIICTFLIYSGSLQKMLTALFNLVSNAQKSKWTIYFECQGKIFLSIEKVLENVSEDQPKMYCNTVFLHIFEIKVSHIYSDTT